MLAAIFAVAVWVVVGSVAACAQMSALPRRFESAAHRWSRRDTLTGTAFASKVPVATAPVTSGDAKNSLMRAAKLKLLSLNEATTRRNSGSLSLQGAEFA